MQLAIVMWLVNVALGTWVFIDARKRQFRKVRALPWSIATMLIGPPLFPFYLVIASYIAVRTLLAGETRKGGPICNALIKTAAFQSLFTAGLLVLRFVVIEPRNMWPVLLGTAISLYVVTVIVAVVAFIMRDPSVEEKGPTGPSRQDLIAGSQAG